MDHLSHNYSKTTTIPKMSTNSWTECKANSNSCLPSIDLFLSFRGYNIGLRLIEDFLAKTNSGRCHDMKETAEKIQMAFKMYLGVSPSVANWSAANDEFSLLIDSNPLTEFVELPENLQNLKYSNVLSGIIRGALEMVRLFSLIFGHFIEYFWLYFRSRLRSRSGSFRTASKATQPLN